MKKEEAFLYFFFFFFFNLFCLWAGKRMDFSGSIFGALKGWRLGVAAIEAGCLQFRAGEKEGIFWVFWGMQGKVFGCFFERLM